MNVAYNNALRQSKAIRNDLNSITTSTTTDLTPSTIGRISASLSTFSKSLDDYAALLRQELVPRKKEEATTRLATFRTDLQTFRSELDSLKQQHAEQQHQSNRSELLGNRKPYAGTPENPYSNSNTSTTTTSSTFQPRHQHTASQTQEYDPNYAREAHAFREQSFFASTNSALDDYIARGQAVLGDLGQQREMLKGTQRRLYGVANTLGISGDTIRMVERRAREDKWIFGAGVIVFFLFCWLVLHYLG